PYSDHTAEVTDREVRKLVAAELDRTNQLLLDKQDGRIKMEEKLMEKEILFQSELEEIEGKRPTEKRQADDELQDGGADDGGVQQTDLPLDHPKDSNNNDTKSEE